MLNTKDIADLPLQKALYARLKTTGRRVFDAPPEDPKKPYIVIGDSTVVDWGTKVCSGDEITHTLHFYSDYDGYAEIKEMMREVLRAVARENLDLSADGFKVVDCRADFTATYRESASVRRGVLRLRFKISQMEG